MGFHGRFAALVVQPRSERIALHLSSIDLIFFKLCFVDLLSICFNLLRLGSEQHLVSVSCCVIRNSSGNITCISSSHHVETEVAISFPLGGLFVFIKIKLKDFVLVWGWITKFNCGIFYLPLFKLTTFFWVLVIHAPVEQELTEMWHFFYVAVFLLCSDLG